MAYSLVVEDVLGDLEFDVWYSPDFGFTNRKTLIEYDAPIPATWEFIGRVFYSYWDVETGGYVLATDPKNIYQSYKNKLIIPAINASEYELIFRFRPFTIPGTLRIWQSDEPPTDEDSEGGMSVIAQVLVDATGAIVAQTNVSSVSNYATGRYRVTFANPTANTSYLVFMLCGGGGNSTRIPEVLARTTTHCDVAIRNESAGYAGANPGFNVMVI